MATLYHAFKSGTITDNPLSSGATQVNSAGFSALPVVASPDILWITLDPLGSAGVPELIKVTAHTSASTQVTCTRGEQQANGGSAARSHALAIPWAHAMTPIDIVTGQAQAFTVSTVSQLGAVAHTVNYAKFTQVGDFVMGYCRITATAAGTANNAITVEVTGLPDTPSDHGGSINSSGGFVFEDLSLTTTYVGACAVNSVTTQFRFVVHNANAQLGVIPNFAIANGDILYFHFLYPVV